MRGISRIVQNSMRNHKRRRRAEARSSLPLFQLENALQWPLDGGQRACWRGPGRRVTALRVSGWDVSAAVLRRRQSELKYSAAASFDFLRAGFVRLSGSGCPPLCWEAGSQSFHEARQLSALIALSRLSLCKIY